MPHGVSLTDLVAWHCRLTWHRLFPFDTMKARTFSHPILRSRFILGRLHANRRASAVDRTRLHEWRCDDIRLDQLNSDLSELSFRYYSHPTSCIDRMEGVTTNAVIAVPDEKYGEVSGRRFRNRSHG